MEREPKLIDVILYADLRRRFGKKFRFAVETPAEAIRALCSQVKGFEAYLRKHLRDNYSIILGGDHLDEEGLAWTIGNAKTLKIVPAIAGADGVFRVIAGAVLIAAGIAINTYSKGPWGNQLITMGAALALGGVAQILTSTVNPNLNATESPTTYTFGSPRVTTGQGRPVPIPYGEIMVGGHVVSAGISAETWQTNGFGGAAPDEIGTRGGNGDTSPWLWAVAPVST